MIAAFWEGNSNSYRIDCSFGGFGRPKTGRDSLKKIGRVQRTRTADPLRPSQWIGSETLGEIEAAKAPGKTQLQDYLQGTSGQVENRL